MRRSIAALAVGVAVFGISGVVAACDSPTYDGVCENTSTQLRTDDKDCQQPGEGTGNAGFIWVYYLASRRIPPAGNGVQDATTDPPNGADLSNGGVPSGGTNGGSDDDDDDKGGSGGLSNNGGGDDDNGGSGGGSGDSGGDDGGDDGGGGGSSGGGGGGGGGDDDG